MNRTRLKAPAFPVILISGLLAIAVGCAAPRAYKIIPVPADQALVESVVLDDGGFALPKIALIDVDGPIMNQKSGGLFTEGEHPVSLFVEKLNKAAADKSVKGVILRINSPGGSVTASDLMYSELLHFKQRTKGEKPVVTVLMDVAASGGYYLACGSDEIVAHRTTITGSIGVIMTLISVADTMNKIGVHATLITSGDMKAAGSPFQKLKPEERRVFQDLVNQFFDRFVEVVAAGRPGFDEERVREIADGRIWSAEDALEMGLIDRIGTLRDAAASMKERIGAKRVRVVTYHRPLGYKPNVYADTPSRSPQLNLINIDVPDQWPYPRAEFLYLWVPGL